MKHVCGRHAECARYVILLAAAVSIAGGCGQERPPTRRYDTPLRQIDAEGLAGLLQRRRGQVALVEFWATWCEPCRRLFPHAVALHRRFRDQGLAVIAVSLDAPDNEPMVRRFLADSGATMENFMASYGVGSAAFSAFQIADGAVPHLRLYDRQGNLRRTFASGGKAIEPEEIKRAVEEMLFSPPVPARSPPASCPWSPAGIGQ